MLLLNVLSDFCILELLLADRTFDLDVGCVIRDRELHALCYPSKEASLRSSILTRLRALVGGGVESIISMSDDSWTGTLPLF